MLSTGLPCRPGRTAATAGPHRVDDQVPLLAPDLQGPTRQATSAAMTASVAARSASARSSRPAGAARAARPPTRACGPATSRPCPMYNLDVGEGERVAEGVPAVRGERGRPAGTRPSRPRRSGPGAAGTRAAAGTRRRTASPAARRPTGCRWRRRRTGRPATSVAGATRTGSRWRRPGTASGCTGRPGSTRWGRRPGSRRCGRAVRLAELAGDEPVQQHQGTEAGQRWTPPAPHEQAAGQHRVEQPVQQRIQREEAGVLRRGCRSPWWRSPSSASRPTAASCPASSRDSGGEPPVCRFSTVMPR